MTHTLRLLCKFNRADDAVYPSSFKAACSGLSAPSKLAVVLFSRHSGFFPQGKNRLRPLRWHDLFVSSSETHIKPYQFWGVFFDSTMVLGARMLAVGGLSRAFGVDSSQAGSLIPTNKFFRVMADRVDGEFLPP